MTKPTRMGCGPGPHGVSTPDDERTVLRLARDALRADPPSVRFIARPAPPAREGVVQWPALD